MYLQKYILWTLIFFINTHAHMHTRARTHTCECVCTCTNHGRPGSSWMLQKQPDFGLKLLPAVQMVRTDFGMLLQYTAVKRVQYTFVLYVGTVCPPATWLDVVFVNLPVIQLSFHNGSTDFQRNVQLSCRVYYRFTCISQTPYSVSIYVKSWILSEKINFKLLLIVITFLPKIYNYVNKG